MKWLNWELAFFGCSVRSECIDYKNLIFNKVPNWIKCAQQLYSLECVCLYSTVAIPMFALKLLINSSNIDDAKMLAQCTHRCFTNLISMLISAYLIVPLPSPPPLKCPYVQSSFIGSTHCSMDEMRKLCKSSFECFSQFNNMIYLKSAWSRHNSWKCVSFWVKLGVFRSETLFLIKNYQNDTVNLMNNNVSREQISLYSKEAREKINWNRVSWKSKAKISH